MSGGHFNYSNECLADIEVRIRKDLRHNDHVNSEDSQNEVWGLNWKPESMVYVRRLMEDVQNLDVLLREYDLAACDDSDEDAFVEAAKAVYGDLNRDKDVAVVPWEKSHIGDCVSIDGGIYEIRRAPSDQRNICYLCAFYERGCPPNDERNDCLCCSHPSEHRNIYFVEVPK